MIRTFVIAGTDTDVGKTVFAAALAGALGASYWKPIQAGLEDGGDSDVVRRLSGLPRERIVPEVYRLRTPASPHRAAELDGIEIDPARLAIGVRLSGSDTLRDGNTCRGEVSGMMGPTPGETPLVIELAGGLLVPLTRSALQIEVVRAWGAPVILCARTALGTINHSLLSIEALRSRAIPIHGIAFIGDANEDSECTISDMGQVRRLGRLARIDPLGPETLAKAFAASFRLEDFA